MCVCRAKQDSKKILKINNFQKVNVKAPEKNNYEII